MWLIELMCSAVIGAAEPCPVYPGNTSTYVSIANFESLKGCEATGVSISRRDHYRTGNDYAFRCVESDYQPKELEPKRKQP